MWMQFSCWRCLSVMICLHPQGGTIAESDVTFPVPGNETNATNRHSTRKRSLPVGHPILICSLCLRLLLMVMMFMIRQSRDAARDRGESDHKSEIWMDRNWNLLLITSTHLHYTLVNFCMSSGSISHRNRDHHQQILLIFSFPPFFVRASIHIHFIILAIFTFSISFDWCCCCYWSCSQFLMQQHHKWLTKFAWGAGIIRNSSISWDLMLFI